jgi:crotonobetainyl-CoA:carnitine CoA-transferase CaiB-like acyl-CoA transferase
VFVDGNAADACAKLGIGYEHQRVRKPDIIYCQYTGFGSEGPYAPIPTHGQMMNTLAGALLQPPDTPMNGTASGGEGTAAGAVHAALHVAAALTYRHNTGKGCFIDVAGVDGVIAQAWIASTYALNDARITDRSTMAQAGGAKYNHYFSKDDFGILFCAIEPKFWKNFCLAVERDDLVEQHGAGPVDFGGGDEQLKEELQAIFSTKTLAEWMAIAAERDIPMGPSYRGLAEAVDDPHLRTRGVIHEQEHPGVGMFTYIGEAGKVAGQPYRVRYPAPALGEHTDEILKELGVSAANAPDRASASEPSGDGSGAQPQGSMGG